MASAAADHEQMPDGVHVGNAVCQIKGDAGGVQNAAGDGEVQGRLTQAGNQIRGSKGDQPAHGQVDTDTRQPEAVPENNLKHHAREGQ